ncbi:MAG: DNA ligase [Campylobacterales bacterium]|nr:DNA ligase [Campylobacterales bacterium]
MLRLFVALWLLGAFADALTLQKAKNYEDQNISGWMMSEKLDGIRAFWDGKKLLSRQAKEIKAPEWFVKNLPPFALDGELWSKRGDFENIQSIVMSQDSHARWQEITYNIFEVPRADGNFTARLAKAKAYIAKHQLRHVKIIHQHRCQDEKHLNQFLESITSLGGEGVIVKDGSADYFEGRSDLVLKVKKAEDMEAEVIGYKEGRGKYQGLLGSLKVRLANGVEFFIGSGLSDEVRANPPKIGEIVTFRYFGFTKEGRPKFASFMRVRRD